MRIFTFTTRTPGQTIASAHLNALQDAVNEISTELSNGIGSVNTTYRTFKLAASVTGAASLNMPWGTAPTLPASGDVWNENGTLKFHDGTTSRALTFTDNPTFTGTIRVGNSTSDVSYMTGKVVGGISFRGDFYDSPSIGVTAPTDVSIGKLLSINGGTARTNPDIPGGDLLLRGGQPTGTGAPGSISFRTYDIGAVSSSTLQIANSVRMDINGTTGKVRVYKDFQVDGVATVAAPTSALTPLVLTSGSADPSSPTSGGLWNNAGTLKYYDGSSIKSVSFVGHTHAIADLTDFTISSPTSYQFLRWNGTKWANSTIGTYDLPIGIPTANIGGGTVDDTELAYLDGVTSGIQGQLNAKAPLASPSLTGTINLGSDSNDSVNINGSISAPVYFRGSFINDPTISVAFPSLSGNAGYALSLNAGAASGTNLTGGDLNLTAGAGSGTGAAGSINFSSFNPGSSGTAVQSPPVARMTITGSTGLVRVYNNLQVDKSVSVMNVPSPPRPVIKASTSANANSYSTQIVAGSTGTLTAVSLTQNTIFYTPIIFGHTGTADLITILNVSTGVTSSNAYLGIYDADGVNGLPGTRLYLSAAVTTATTGAKTTAALSLAVVVGKLYYVAIADTGATVVVDGRTGTNQLFSGSTTTATGVFCALSGGSIGTTPNFLPTSATTTFTSVQTYPLLTVRVN